MLFLECAFSSVFAKVSLLQKAVQKTVDKNISFFEKFNKINKTLVKLMNEKKNTQFFKVRNKRRDITVDTEVQELAGIL